MQKLPKVIASSVVRSAQQGESHGGVYLVDLQTRDYEQVIDWNDGSISWKGRGGDRGLRGIAFFQDKIYLAASDEIFVYDKEFRRLGSYTSRYLKLCHEICISGETLYLTSTNLNSILEFDLKEHLFKRGYEIARASPLGRLVRRSRFNVAAFDPNESDSAVARRAQKDLHINNVSRVSGTIYISGTRMDALLALEHGRLREHAALPIGTHNATVYDGGVIYNDTRSNQIVIKTGKFIRSFAVPTYDPAQLLHTDVPKDHARQGFARGLSLFGDDLLIGGSSPSTISVYSIASGERLTSVNLSKDIRNCIHGLALWPD